MKKDETSKGRGTSSKEKLAVRKTTVRNLTARTGVKTGMLGTCGGHTCGGMATNCRNTCFNCDVSSGVA